MPKFKEVVIQTDVDIITSDYLALAKCKTLKELKQTLYWEHYCFEVDRANRLAELKQNEDETEE